jgi:hypothetical protein
MGLFTNVLNAGIHLGTIAKIVFNHMAEVMDNSSGLSHGTKALWKLATAAISALSVETSTSTKQPLSRAPRRWSTRSVACRSAA